MMQQAPQMLRLPRKFWGRGPTTGDCSDGYHKRCLGGFAAHRDEPCPCICHWGWMPRYSKGQLDLVVAYEATTVVALRTWSAHEPTL